MLVAQGAVLRSAAGSDGCATVPGARTVIVWYGPTVLPQDDCNAAQDLLDAAILTYVALALTRSFQFCVGKFGRMTVFVLYDPLVSSGVSGG